MILARADAGQWVQTASAMSTIEIDAIRDRARRSRVRRLLPKQDQIHSLTESTFIRAGEIAQLGFDTADAVHLAAEEEAGADVFLTCDDALVVTARRAGNLLTVKVSNPVEWLNQDIENADT
ncbi:MAG TPA: hypothetical protein VGM05_15480 [Planctomycetaceae bacterium]